jgi:hypothetical protein
MRLVYSIFYMPSKVRSRQRNTRSKTKRKYKNRKLRKTFKGGKGSTSDELKKTELLKRIDVELDTEDNKKLFLQAKDEEIMRHLRNKKSLLNRISRTVSGKTKNIETPLHKLSVHLLDAIVKNFEEKQSKQQKFNKDFTELYSKIQKDVAYENMGNYKKKQAQQKLDSRMKDIEKGITDPELLKLDSDLTLKNSKNVGDIMYASLAGDLYKHVGKTPTSKAKSRKK